MNLLVDTEKGKLEVRDAMDCKRLSAEISGGGNLSAALGSFGKPDEDGAHLWISIDHLRRAAAPQDSADWQSQFDAMIKYAASKGWVDASAAYVRVHLVRP